jgi:ubiquinone/menaquinone biosynthesis C-methylase UbiE
MLAVYILLAVLGLVIISQVISRIMVKYFRYAPPVPSFTGPIMDSNVRRLVQPPREIIERSGIAPGMQVLDLGSGSGTFTIDVARAIGGQGRVYALDIQPAMLKQLAEKLARPENKDIGNVELIEGSAAKLPFSEASLDLVYLVSVLQEIPRRPEALAEIKRVLRPGGILAVSETLMDIDYFLKSTVIKMAGQAGFIMDGAAGNLWSYTVRFTRP